MKAVHHLDVSRGGSGFLDEASGKPAVPHGLRSTFRTWVTDCTDFPGDMAEVALLHKVGSKVQQAYDRAHMVEKRRAMMAAWIAFMEGSEAPAASAQQGPGSWAAAISQAAQGIAVRRGRDPDVEAQALAEFLLSDAPLAQADRRLLADLVRGRIAAPRTDRSAAAARE